METSWGLKEGSLPDWYGATLIEQIAQCGDPIRAMYIFALNPVVSYPDSNLVKQSLEKLDFLVVQDIFWTETCEYADVVLPGASFAEKDGTFTSGERRINRVRKAVEPPGDAKADWEIFVMLAQKLGLKGFDFKSPQEIWDDMRKVTPSMQDAAMHGWKSPNRSIGHAQPKSTQAPRSSMSRNSLHRMVWVRSSASNTGHRPRSRTQSTPSLS